MRAKDTVKQAPGRRRWAWRHNGRSQHVMLTLGEQWMLDGEALEDVAGDAQAALAEVHKRAEQFPVNVTVLEGDLSLELVMDSEGNVTELSDEDRADRSSRKGLVIGAAVAAALLVAGGGAAAVWASGEEEPAAAPSEPQGPVKVSWSLKDGQEPVAIGGGAVIVQDDQSVRLLDFRTGEVRETLDMDTSERWTVMHGSSNLLAVDGGAGTVVVITDGKAMHVDGSLVAGGAEPVIQNGETVTMAADLEDESTLPEGAVLVGSAEEGPVVLGEDEAISYPGQAEVELKAPGSKVELKQVISADERRIISLWEKGKHELVAVHDPDTGKLRADRKTPEDGLTLADGRVLFAEGNHFGRNGLQEVCAEPEVITGEIVCDTDEGWQVLSTEVTYDEEPMAVGDEAYIDADGTFHATIEDHPTETPQEDDSASAAQKTTAETQSPADSKPPVEPAATAAAPVQNPSQDGSGIPNAQSPGAPPLLASGAGSSWSDGEQPQEDHRGLLTGSTGTHTTEDSTDRAGHSGDELEENA